MKLKASYKYQLFNHFSPIIIYYIIVIALYSFLTVNIASAPVYSITRDSSGRIMSATHVTATSIGFSGTSAATVIFLFIVALNSFKEIYKMQMQNGLSRKTILISRTLVSLTVAAGLAVIDELVLLIFEASTSSTGHNIVYSTLLNQYYETGLSEIMPATIHLESVIYDFFLFLGFMAAGYFLTLLFYRLNKIGKIAVGAGVPILIFVIIPIIDYSITDHKINQTFFRLLYQVLGYTSHSLPMR
jgi:hypothetical protein